MRKLEEQVSRESCLNKAADDEMIFVLLGRDPAAADIVRCWVQRRIELGLNTMADEKIVSALLCADIMERER